MNERPGLLGGVLAIVVAGVAVCARFPGGEWFALLVKPAWTAPPWALAGGWTATWWLLALSAWRAGRWGLDGAGPAATAWLGSMVLICIWSWLLFGLHRPGWSLVAGGLLVPVTGAAMVLLGRLDRGAGILLVPALAWVAWMWAQNLAWWRLNGGGWSTLLP